MNEKTRIIIDAAYENAINLKLFSALLSMTASSSDEDNAVLKCSRMEDCLPWKSRRNEIGDFFAPYGLRYAGEVLERFEEHFGSGVENLRAVALALGYASPFLPPSAFIGRQKENFLKKLEQEAGQDAYLQGARYMLSTDGEARTAILNKLSKTVWKKTEEALFVLSLYGDKSAGFEIMRPQMQRLWGPERSVSLSDNIRLLDWLTARYAFVIKACRKKENALLRTLLQLRQQFVRPETPAYQTLTQGGYSELEIRFANVWQPIMGDPRDRMDPDGIPGERAAAQFCVSVLNSDEEVPDNLFRYTALLLERYRTFRIRYEGNEGIWNAVKDSLRPKRPQTLLWMERNITNNPTFPFDVFSPKWDILARELPADRYRLLFTEQLLAQKGRAKEELGKWLARYHTLTGLDYCDAFNVYNGSAYRAFSLLAESGTIDLWTLFSKQKGAGGTEAMAYISSFVMPVKSRQAFDFLKKMLEEYPISQWPDIFGERLHNHVFIKRYDRGYRRVIELDLQRDFLSDAELRQLYRWVDESIYCTEPENYYEHIVCALGNSCVQRIFPKEQLAKVLKALEAAKAIDSQSASVFKELFFTPEELEKDRQAQAISDAQAKADTKRAELERAKTKLMKDYDGTLQSICKHIRHDILIE